MLITTSYLGNLKKIPSNFLPIAIVRYLPNWATCLNYQALAPTGQMLIMTEKDYILNFNIILQKLDINKVLSDLINISKGKDICLLCYEKPGEFCHRHIVADWIKSNSIYDVKELINKSELQIKYTQETLF